MENFTISLSSETTLSFSWTQPRIVADNTTGYILTCSSLLEGTPSPDPLVIGPTVTTANVTELLSGVTYSCEIITLTSEGRSQPQTLNSTTVETGQFGSYSYECFLFSTCSVCDIVPAGAPEVFVASAGERQVNFSWSPPPVALRNGVITSYTLSCSPSPSSLLQSPSQPGPLTVAGFSPDTSYSCSVVASNSRGSGSPANTSFTTRQDCENSQLMMCFVLQMQ